MNSGVSGVTGTDVDTTKPPQQPAIEDTDQGWRAMLDEWARYQWRQFHGGREPLDWPPVWALPTLIIGAAALVITLISGILLPLIRWVAGFLSRSGADGMDLLRDWAAAQLVLDSVRRYLTSHAEGLPFTSSTLWWTWSAAGIALFLLASFRFIAGRVGWILFGAASVGMVWTTAPEPGHTTAAGITALWWIILSLPALRRSWRTPEVAAYLPQLPTLAKLLQRRSEGGPS